MILFALSWWQTGLLVVLLFVVVMIGGAWIVSAFLGAAQGHDGRPRPTGDADTLLQQWHARPQWEDPPTDRTTEKTPCD